MKSFALRVLPFVIVFALGVAVGWVVREDSTDLNDEYPNKIMITSMRGKEAKVYYLKPHRVTYPGRENQVNLDTHDSNCEPWTMRLDFAAGKRPYTLLADLTSERTELSDTTELNSR